MIRSVFDLHVDAPVDTRAAAPAAALHAAAIPAAARAAALVGAARPPSSPADDELARRLHEHVQTLAGRIGERNFWRYAALEQAADYIAAQLVAAGWAVEEQRFPARWLGRTREVRNLIVELPEEKRDRFVYPRKRTCPVFRADGGARGQGAAAGAEIVVIGAHYDSRRGTPGANDNASGVAVLLELVRVLSTERPRGRTLRLAAFVNEELPFARGRCMGSRVYAERCAARGERIAAMLALETLGCYSDREGSQRYPRLLGTGLPRRGDFVACVGQRQARELVGRCVAAFRRGVDFPCLGATGRGLFHFGRSDHWSFARVGYAGAMFTDTAGFRSEHYHGPGDTPERLDYASLARVVAGLAAVGRDLLGNGA